MSKLGTWSFPFQTFRTLHHSFLLFFFQIVQEVKQFYSQTFDSYQTTKQPALKETLKAIQYSVSVEFHEFFFFFLIKALDILFTLDKHFFPPL